MSAVTLESGSFRDRTNRVFYQNGDVYRALNAAAAKNFAEFKRTRVYERYVASGQVVATEVSRGAAPPPDSGEAWTAVLRHERIPYISYPYEWTFSMLQDAAVLHLDLLRDALEENFTLKDATAYNIQWRGSRPVFIDIPSFIPWRHGQPWVGYRQFCQLFLFPLLLQAHRGVAFQPWLRGSIDGISVNDCSRLLARDFYKPGVFKDAIIHARLQSSVVESSQSVEDDLQKAGFHKELITANLSRLKKIIEGLSWRKKSSAWSDYAQTCTYTEADFHAKKTFVENVVRKRPRHLVWDLGCNTGDFSRLAARHADYVVAVDGDAPCAETFYQALKSERVQNVLPLTMSLTDSSAGLGWLGQERKAFGDRGHPDLILCLALLHHICITANIPMAEWIAWLAHFRADLVIEFIGPDDPMAQRLLANQDIDYPDYQQPLFESALARHFEIKEKQPLGSRNRILYFCEVKR